MNKQEKKRLMFLKDMSLMLGMFFLPFGYDFLFKLIMDVTSFWTADLVFYGISGLFLTIYVIVTTVLNRHS